VFVPDLWISPNSAAFERGSMSYSIDELLSWMIIADDDTAANTLIEYLGYNYINGCCEKFGMSNTAVEGPLGETNLPGKKYNNITCAQDMLTFFEMIYRNRGLSRWLCEYAGRLFLRQRDKSGFMRYICDDIYVGHKSGEMPTASHESGIFYLRYVDYFLAIFTANTSEAPRCKLETKRMRGRIADMIYNYYLEREDAIHNLPYNPNGDYGENKY
jgi:beta-lactamase class A